MKSDRRFDLYALGLAVALHAAVFGWLVLSDKAQPRRRTTVEVEIRKPPPPPPVVIPPPPEPPQIVKKVERPPEAPRTTRRPPPREPPRPVVPVFGVDKNDTSDKGGFSVPLGNTTLADPNKRPKEPVAPLPAAEVPGGKEYHPLNEAELRKPPGHDADACFAGVKDKYSTSQAYTEGVEGEVVFRIELSDQGKIRNIRKVKGIGHGIDELAMGWLRFNPKCRFTPAIGKDGRPGAYIIERYSITFEIAR